MAFSFELSSANLRYKDVAVLSNINLSISAGEHVISAAAILLRTDTTKYCPG
jgi:ABC-type molybdenum transport system ATPase subunit/photorepair protein PhrA